MSSEKTSKNQQVAIVPAAAIQARILVVRSRQVMLDQDLAELYGVETKGLTRGYAATKTGSRPISCSA